MKAPIIHCLLLVWSWTLPWGRALNLTDLDCRMRRLALGFGRSLQGWRHDVDGLVMDHLLKDALELESLCHDHDEIHLRHSSDPYYLLDSCPTKFCIFVDPSHPLQDTDHDNGHVHASLSSAIDWSRSSIKNPSNTTIILRRGVVHYLDQPIRLVPADSGLTILGTQSTSANQSDIPWISGAIPIPNDIKWDWDCDLNIQVRVANLSSIFISRNNNDNHAFRIPRIPSLFAPGKRLIRARFPNGNPETVQWGYRSPDRFQHCIPAEQVVEWHKPEKGAPPTFEYIDLRQHYPSKNDSTMELYNVYATGRGGVCETLWGGGESYWCSNASAGGWAEVDRECARNGQLQIPLGMTYNQTTLIGQYLDDLGASLEGGIVHGWHSQTWAMHMFEVEQYEDGVLKFTHGSGKQGGRNWCRCDQCTYAGRWCGQHQDPPQADDRLIGGNWMLENVFRALDDPDEFFLDPKTNLLYVYPNATSANPTGLRDLSLAVLDKYIIIDGASDITISNVGFKDSAATYMNEWRVPSGGDWALHPGGVVQISNSSRITIDHCVFHRLDGNAIFLSGRTRDIKIQRNRFEWLGENAIALWGETEGYDATKGEQPYETLIEGNVMRELGIFQKQSSAVFLSKASRTVIRHNIMFNMPRSAINFNDMTGGGDRVHRNLIFNTCRESGDHGPINTWDRMPFLTTLRTGKPSFQPLYRVISDNFLFGNYGAGFALDNDDGSSWYKVHRNVLYQSEGFKMDYGGHDSHYEHNIVIALPDGGKCINFGSFLEGHAHVVQNNKCLVATPGAASEEPIPPIIALASCDGPTPVLRKNEYFTPSGTAMATCAYQSDAISFADFQHKGLEVNSTVHKLPEDGTTIVQWCQQLLFESNKTRQKSWSPGTVII